MFCSLKQITLQSVLYSHPHSEIFLCLAALITLEISCSVISKFWCPNTMIVNEVFYYAEDMSKREELYPALSTQLLTFAFKTNFSSISLRSC